MELDMTTMTLTIDDKSQDILEALKTILSNFKGISFEIETIETKEDVLDSFRVAMQDIQSGKGVENAISSEDFLKEFSND